MNLLGGGTLVDMAHRGDLLLRQHLQLSATIVTTRILNVAASFMENGVWNVDLIQELRESCFAHLNQFETQMQSHSNLEHHGKLIG